MYIGFVQHEHYKSTLSKIYNKTSEFTAVKCDGLKKLCDMDLREEADSDLIDIPYSRMITSEANNVRECVKNICEKENQIKLSSIALSKVNYAESRLFTVVEGETVDSIDKLKDKFYISKIRLPSLKKILGGYLFDIDMKADTVTFDGSGYKMNIKVLMKKSPFEFKVTNVGFDVDKKGGE